MPSRVATLSSGADPTSIATGPDGNLWVADTTPSAVGRITTAGVVTEFPLPLADASPTAITLGPDGNLRFTDSRNGKYQDKVGFVTPAGAITEVPLQSGDGDFLRGLGPQPVGRPGQFTIQAPLGGITMGPGGNLYFSEASLIGEAIPGATDAPIAASADGVNAVAGREFAAAVAHFTDADPTEPPDNYYVTIDWGDGTYRDTNPGVLRPDGHGGDDVLALHTYPTFNVLGGPLPRTYPVTVTIFDPQAVGSIPTTVVGTANVPLPSIDLLTSDGIHLQEDRPGHVTLADVFTGFNYTPSLAQSGVIDWGDGTPPVAATVTVVGGRGPYTTLSGDHTYANGGAYIVKLTTVPAETFSRLIILNDSGLGADPSPPPISVPSGVTATNALVATFNLFNEPTPAGLSARNYWGDQTGVNDGVITKVGDVYQVTGSHTFATPGRYTYGVKVTAQDGESATVIATVVVGSLNERFVAQAYRDLVARPVDPASLSYWTAAMDNGISSFQVSLALQTSREGRTLSAGRLYYRLMGEVAPSWMLEVFVNFLSTGGTPERLEALLIGPDTYARAHGAVGNAGFETALLQQVDHRAPTAQEVQVMDQVLASGASRADVAEAFLTTPEGLINRANDYAEPLIGPDITDAFHELLAGDPDDDVVAVIVTSQAYLSKL